MLGSLTFYRRILHENVFSSPSFIALTRASIHKIYSAEEEAATKLPTIGHAIAGVMAGATVSFIAVCSFRFSTDSLLIANRHR